MNTFPSSPAWRARAGAQVRGRAQALRHLDFPPLLEELRVLLPPWLLAAEEEGPNSRQRIFSLRLTFECFVWQMLKPRDLPAVKSSGRSKRSIMPKAAARPMKALALRGRRAPAPPLGTLGKGLGPHRANRGCAGGKARSTPAPPPGQGGRLLHRAVVRYFGKSETLPATFQSKARLCQNLPLPRSWFFQLEQRRHPAHHRRPLENNHDLRLLRGLL